MSVQAAPGCGREHLATIRPGWVALDQVQQSAVHQTVARYAFAMDQHDLEALAGILTEHALWRFQVGGEGGSEPVVGREAVIRLVGDTSAAEVDQHRHNLLNVTLHSADSGTALVHAYLTLTTNAGGRSEVIATGFYIFTLAHAGGEWRIAELFLGTDNAW